MVVNRNRAICPGETSGYRLMESRAKAPLTLTSTSELPDLNTHLCRDRTTRSPLSTGVSPRSKMVFRRQNVGISGFSK